jgi:hypothetical protein
MTSTTSGIKAMPFLAEQHLMVAKLLRVKAACLSSAEEERAFIAASNRFLVCTRLAASSRGTLNLDAFDWDALYPDWTIIEEQIVRLPLPDLEAPRTAPD